MFRLSFADYRDQTAGEEIANSVSHGIALIAALAASPILIISKLQHGDIFGVVGAGVFATTVVSVYLASTVYHALPSHRGKRIARIADLVTVYLLIAGTYTPFTLGVLRGPWGWTMFGLVWSLALVGIALTVSGRLGDTHVATGVYVLMGWLAIIAMRPLLQLVPTQGLIWIAAGGAAYTAGVLFFVTDEHRFHHFTWHLFVIAGTACHFVAVAQYSV